MPVHIEWIESPSEQDWLDLEKLYKDAPVQWFEGVCEHTAQDYIATKKQQDYKIVAGRFNDRLIVGATLKAQQGPSCYLLEELCVRSATRKRGVARQMLTRLCQWSSEQKCTLLVKDENAQYKTLLEYGFIHAQGIWKRQG
ncbi:MAG: acetyl-CoA sensor PanZ family protein [Bermanella sp.]